MRGKDGDDDDDDDDVRFLSYIHDRLLYSPPPSFFPSILRALFAEAEEEEKRCGVNSGLHIIILDEIDAICKQRGSGGAGASGMAFSEYVSVFVCLSFYPSLPPPLPLSPLTPSPLSPSPSGLAKNLEI